jgi:hypothetical protein
VEVTRGTMSVAEGPAAGDGGLGSTAGGGLKLASVPVTTRLRQGGAGDRRINGADGWVALEQRVLRWVRRL